MADQVDSAIFEGLMAGLSGALGHELGWRQLRNQERAQRAAREAQAAELGMARERLLMEREKLGLVRQEAEVQLAGARQAQQFAAKREPVAMGLLEAQSKAAITAATMGEAELTEFGAQEGNRKKMADLGVETAEGNLAHIKEVHANWVTEKEPRTRLLALQVEAAGLDRDKADAELRFRQDRIKKAGDAMARLEVLTPLFYNSGMTPIERQAMAAEMGLLWKVANMGEGNGADYTEGLLKTPDATVLTMGEAFRAANVSDWPRFISLWNAANPKDPIKGAEWTADRTLKMTRPDETTVMWSRDQYVKAQVAAGLVNVKEITASAEALNRRIMSLDAAINETNKSLVSAQTKEQELHEKQSMATDSLTKASLARDAEGIALTIKDLRTDLAQLRADRNEKGALLTATEEMLQPPKGEAAPSGQGTGTPKGLERLAMRSSGRVAMIAKMLVEQRGMKVGEAAVLAPALDRIATALEAAKGTPDEYQQAMAYAYAEWARAKRAPSPDHVVRRIVAGRGRTAPRTGVAAGG